MTPERILYWALRVQDAVREGRFAPEWDVNTFMSQWDTLMRQWETPGELTDGVALCNCICHVPIGSGGVHDASTRCVHCAVFGH